jgi:hypothetical protein
MSGAVSEKATLTWSAKPVLNLYASEDRNWLVAAESLADANAVVCEEHGWERDELADECAEITRPWPESELITMATKGGLVTLTPAGWAARAGRGILFPREHDGCQELLPDWAHPREDPELPGRAFFVSFVLALQSHLPAALFAEAIAATETLVSPAASAPHDRQRAYRCADWAVRVLTADALEAARHVVLASWLRTLPPLSDPSSAHFTAQCALAAHEEASASYHRGPLQPCAPLYAAACADAAQRAAWAAVSAHDLTVVAAHAAHALSHASYACPASHRGGVLRRALGFVYELCTTVTTPR